VGRCFDERSEWIARRHSLSLSIPGTRPEGIGIEGRRTECAVLTEGITETTRIRIIRPEPTLTVTETTRIRIIRPEPTLAITLAKAATTHVALAKTALAEATLAITLTKTTGSRTEGPEEVGR